MDRTRSRTQTTATRWPRNGNRAAEGRPVHGLHGSTGSPNSQKSKPTGGSVVLQRRPAQKRGASTTPPARLISPGGPMVPPGFYFLPMTVPHSPEAGRGVISPRLLFVAPYGCRDPHARDPSPPGGGFFFAYPRTNLLHILPGLLYCQKRPQAHEVRPGRTNAIRVASVHG